MCGDASDAGAFSVEQVPSTPPEDTPSALEDPIAAGLPEPLVDPTDIRPGGPPPDGIPAIDEPRLQRADEIDWLDDAEAVLSVTVDGETRGY
ncbi:MAG: DUF3179 domain-containing (seleno)protein, partial [Acidimicrobiia bacterium]